MTVIRHKLDRAIACTCGSTAVIDRRQHADDCLRGLWRDYTDEVDALSTTQGAVQALREIQDVIGDADDPADDAARLVEIAGIVAVALIHHHRGQ